MNGAQPESRRQERPAPPEPHAPRAEVIALPTRRRRAARTGRHIGDDPPELVADIHTLDGPDADRLLVQQARVIREVTAWMAHKAPEHTADRAA